MNNRVFNNKAMENLLCPVCIAAFTDASEEEKDIAEKNQLEEQRSGERQARDIYKMEQEAQEMESDILKSLPPKDREETWARVAGVQELAERRSRRETSDWAEQGMLYNILMAVSVKAAQSYDPSRGTKFSTWVYYPWQYAVRDFWRAKRVHTQSLSRPLDPDSRDSSSIEDVMEDKNAPSPGSQVEAMEWKDLGSKIFDGDSMAKTMIEDACQQYEWLCPFCRHSMRKYFLNRNLEEKAGDLLQEPVPNVYARRQFWAGCAENLAGSPGNT